MGSVPSDRTTFERYHIVETIGRGGSSTVYRVRDDSGDSWAMKVIDTRGLRPSARARFEREAELLDAAATDPTLAFLPRLIHRLEIEQDLVLISEFVDGVHLDEALRDAPIRDRVQRLVDVATYVGHLHTAMIVHRDLKPSNILLDRHGQIRLVDLGIARPLGGQYKTTTTQEWLGTPLYMAPERSTPPRGVAEDHRAAFDTQTDVFGLAATAFHVLTGEPPYDPDMAAEVLMLAIQGGRHRDPHDVAPSLPRGLADVLRRGLESTPIDRYASAHEFGADLQRWLDGDPPLAQRRTPFRRTTRWMQRNPAAAVAVFLGAMLGSLIVGSLPALWFAVRPDRIEVSADRSVASVVSTLGWTLQNWHGGAENAVASIKTFEHDGEQRWAVAFARHSRIHSGDLLLLDFEYGRVPIHVIDGNRPRLPESVPTSIVPGSDQLDIWRMLTADIIGDGGMPELITVQILGSSSQSVIRIWTADPESDARHQSHRAPTGDDETSPGAYRLVHEVWHDGHMDALAWMPQQRVLIVSGYCSEGTPIERGFDVPEEDRTRAARIIFALDLDEITQPTETGWIRTPGGIGTVEPLWYGVIGPVVDFARTPYVIKLTTTEFDSETPDFCKVQIHNAERPDDNAAFYLDSSGVRHGEEWMDAHLSVGPVTWAPLPPLRR